MKKNSYLRQRLAEYGIDKEYLCEQLDRSDSYITKCLSSCTPWDLDEQYKIMELIGEPYNRLHVVFPKDGIAGKPEKGIADMTIAEFVTALLRKGS